MKLTKKMMTFLATLTLSSTMAFASEGGVGNGGVSVVCRDKADRIESAQILDIYEGEVRFGKKYERELDPDAVVELVQLKLVNYPGFLSSFREELAKVKAMMLYIPVGNDLAPTNDAFPVIMRSGCKFEQLANYTDDGDLLVSQEIYNELANVDRAALLVHEVVYSLFRKGNAKDSRQARKLTAELLAQNFDQALINKIIEKNSGGAGGEGTCGLYGSVDDRIQNCNKRTGLFDLVAKTKEGFEVYKDLASGLLWGDKLSSTMTHFDAEKACKADLAEVAKLNGLNWRLPTQQEYKDAVAHGIRRAPLPNMNDDFWSSTLYPSGNNMVAEYYTGTVRPNPYYVGGIGYRGYSRFSVRCVAR
jgi:hypothetical protein